MTTLKVGDRVAWEGQVARIAACLEHPQGYIIEYTVSGGPEWGKTKVVKASALHGASETLPELFAELRSLRAREEAVLTRIAELQGER